MGCTGLVFGLAGSGVGLLVLLSLDGDGRGGGVGPVDGSVDGVGGDVGGEVGGVDGSLLLLPPVGLVGGVGLGSGSVMPPVLPESVGVAGGSSL